MTRILIVYASSHGQTLAITDAIAARLRAAGHEVDLANALADRPPTPDGYQVVILGSRVHQERHAGEIETYAQVHRHALARVSSAFFWVSLSAAQRDAGPDPHGYIEAFFRRTRWRADRWIAFGGALRYRDYGVFLRFVMKHLGRKAGHPTDTSRNHDLTDWAAVDRFAAEVAVELGRKPSAA